MSDFAIRVEGLSKKYTLGRAEARGSLREALTNTARSLADRLRKPRAGGGAGEEFLALHDINFEIRPGERVGIIGRNGAGKSTLLKILSRITEPSKGRIAIRGRVASLLEVGTGFHPELTGRENIYLNGAILGMSKAEISRKFDEIVEFSEVEKFLDTPVKRYSSGMYVRLAFAVAAHLEPEILIVDEVLAVGDAQFQEKCLGKMKEVSRQDRTVLFVSHNMSAIQALCRRCLVLQKGNLIFDQACSEAIGVYMEYAKAATSFLRPAQSNGRPTLTRGSLKTVGPEDEPRVRVELEITADRAMQCAVEMRLADATGTPIGFGSLGMMSSDQMLKLREGVNPTALEFSVSQLAIGNYVLSFDLTLPYSEYYDRAESCLAFEVSRPPKPGYMRALLQKWGYGSLEIPVMNLSANLHYSDSSSSS